MTDALPIEKVLGRLEDHRPAGEGRWKARCPTHEDRQRSLSIRLGDDGRVLLHCFAGCETKAVVAGMSLEMRDLMPPIGCAVKPSIQAERPPEFPTMAEAVNAMFQAYGRCSRRWQYNDATGEVAGVIMRWDGADGKQIRPVSRIDGGRWSWQGMPTPRPLYRLPQIAGTKNTAIVVEGEKCADAAWQIGLPATTSPHGSNSAKHADWSPLAGREVVIFPDNDDAGWRYAADVACLLHKLQRPARVRIVELPGLKHKEDMYDFITKSRKSGMTDAAIRVAICGSVNTAAA